MTFPVNAEELLSFVGWAAAAFWLLILLWALLPLLVSLWRAIR